MATGNCQNGDASAQTEYLLPGRAVTCGAPGARENLRYEMSVRRLRQIAARERLREGGIDCAAGDCDSRLRDAVGLQSS